jgi:hypothetical protein
MDKDDRVTVNGQEWQVMYTYNNDWEVRLYRMVEDYRYADGEGYGHDNPSGEIMGVPFDKNDL